MFVDRAKIFIKAGKGGDGAVTFRRDPYVPEGGPDGGDGGDGGNVVFLADDSLRTLMDFRYKKKYQAENGQNGMKKKRFGKKGEDLVIKVPPGTMIIDEETGHLMKDLVNPGDSFVAIKGGRGGKGNVHFKNSVRQAPNFAEAGGESKERNVILEMKLIADVGLVGFPNVGKSSILSVTSNANAKVGNYHFTTIKPNLGVVELNNTSFVMADIAGLIEGASQGAGMGFYFLKHVERTRLLIHVVDVAGSEGRNPIEDFDKIMNELTAYSQFLADKPQIVAANKIDLVTDEESYKEFIDYIESKGLKVFPICAPTKEGLKPLMEEAARMLSTIEANNIEQTLEQFDFDKDDYDPEYKKVTVRRENHYYVIEGKQLNKIFRSTNFNDISSIRYLYKYIERSGAIEQLKELGLEEGDTIKINDLEFDYIDEF
ncbi:MAG: GTPase ObgE [Eubacteriales bacterium]|nr:GTPase ObgE [Eubacteriales bacterium]MDY3332962.1 GTPase ObgE [Gallibacter sp.]